MDDSIGKVDDGGVLLFGCSLFRVVGGLFNSFGIMKVEACSSEILDFSNLL